jgi:hypothetical protein
LNQCKKIYNLSKLFLTIKKLCCNQSLVDLVVIDIELGRENHSSFPQNSNRRKLKPLNARNSELTSESDEISGKSQKTFMLIFLQLE